MNSTTSILVFCGSSPGSDPAFMEAAKMLGSQIGSRGFRLIYGGADIGLMGAVADAVLEAGGTVTGVLPRFLADKEIAHKGVSQLELTNTMHERKTRMAELADGVIALPGGIGTLEELCEIFTWAQLRLHNKPIGILNQLGFYDPLLTLLDSMVEKGFLGQGNRADLLEAKEPGALLELLLKNIPEKPSTEGLKLS